MANFEDIYDTPFSNFLPEAVEVKRLLELLPDGSKLNGSAIEGGVGGGGLPTAVQVRDLLETLTGNDRLSEDAIKDPDKFDITFVPSNYTRNDSIPEAMDLSDLAAHLKGIDTKISTAIHKDIAGEIVTISEKITPVNGDLIIIEDSADSNNKKRLQVGNLPGGTDSDAIHDNVASEISAITEKITPVGTDFLLIEDSADSNNKKRLQVGNLPGGTDSDAIHDNVASEISAITEKITPVGTDFLLIEDSADSNNKKRLQVGNLPGGTDSDAIHDNVASEISAITEKITPVGTDFLLIEDSADSNNKKRLQVGNLPGGTDSDAIHDNVASEISAITEKITPVGTDFLLIEDSADSNNKKRLQVGNLPGGTDSDAIHDNVASEISAITNKATPIGADFLLIEDSADSNNKKHVLISSLPGGGDVTAAAVLADNAIIRGDGGAKGVQDSGILIDDSDIITGVTCLEIEGTGATHRLIVRNNTASGELISGLNLSGDEIFQVNQSPGEDGILRVFNAAGNATIEIDEDHTKIGSGAGGANTDWDLIIQGALSGTNGLFICAGENEDDISLRIKDADGTFQILDVHADDGQFVFGDTYANTKASNPTVYGIDNQYGGGDQSDFNTQNGRYRIEGNAVIYGTHYQRSEKTTTQSTTSTGFVEYHTFTTTALDAGDYLIMWNLCFSGTAAQSSSIRIQVDNSVALIDAGGTGEMLEESETDADRNNRSGQRVVTLTAGTHQIDCDFHSESGGSTTTMRQTEFILMRVN